MSYSYSLAFMSGLFSMFHCLGMCGGMAGGFFIGYGWQKSIVPLLLYHAMRIFGYVLLGITGALLGRVVAQMGIVGKAQGIIEMVFGILIVLIGLYLMGLFTKPATKKSGACAGSQVIPFFQRTTRSGQFAPAFAGLVNGLIPCALVFSVALKAAETASPLQASLLMLAFGVGTLPTLLLISTLGTMISCKARGLLSRAAGIFVVLLGLWTFYEGWSFFRIIRGLANW